MTWLPRGEKKFEDIFIRFGATHERDRQTDGQTDRQTDGHRMPAIAALCMASHGKNQWCCAFNSLTPDTKIEF